MNHYSTHKVFCIASVSLEFGIEEMVKAFAAGVRNIHNKVFYDQPLNFHVKNSILQNKINCNL